MNISIYPKLAWNGITKNRKLYFPFIITCIGMITMFYIIHSISVSPLLSEMRGGSSLGAILSLGKFVIAAFSLIFLYYTNSFLIRRRYKEFGLLNILGIDKRGLVRISALEILYVAVISLVFGLFFGIVLSKFAELGLLNAVKADINYKFVVPSKAVVNTLEIFCIIFVILLLRSVIKVSRAKPLELMKSENFGEKAPKANWIFALAGVILLGVAYYMAVSIKTPLSAITLFFVAVIMVIVATYLLFISGSVALCKLLQKNKNYYYKKNHFVSVSSMAYRMKRNGAGLASICILSTMVLVMLSSTTSLYVGENDSLASRFPRENEIALVVNSVDNLKPEMTTRIKQGYEAVFERNGVTPENVTDFTYCITSGVFNNEALNIHANTSDFELLTFNDLRNLYFMRIDDYNTFCGTDYKLTGNDVLIMPVRCDYTESVIKIDDIELYVKDTITDYPDLSEANVDVVPSLMLVVSDLNILKPIDGLLSGFGSNLLESKYYYGFDLDGKRDDVMAIYDQVRYSISEVDFLGDEGYQYSSSCMAREADDFFMTFGGLFFVGIILSIVFIFAAAMIIYYKQVSEGYEDRARFEIMQNVGMTKKDIKKSINSQVLTVFFAPLLLAGLHLAFSFPLVWKILRLFNLHNLKLVIIVTVCSFILFGIFYALIYKATAHSYYSIVTTQNDD